MARGREPQIVAMGGLPTGTALEEFLLAIARGPRICLVPTASAERPEHVVWFYEGFVERARPSHLVFHPWPPENLRDFLLSQDVIYVGGGNTANMLAIWRVHGADAILREAWEEGIVLAGWSAGMICWFEAGVTDSFGQQLEGMDCLGFLSGSACPHYDGEELRRPRYHELVRGGFPGGLAADDGVGLYFRGTELAEIVTVRRGAQAYRVELVDGEVRELPLGARMLT